MIELACMRWLRYEKRCSFILEQRSPLYNGGIPDVIGVTKSREVTEIEVKRSVSDFKANANKRCIQIREHYLDRWPKQYYFAIPIHLQAKIEPIVPEWAGLLVVDGHIVTVAKVAPINKAAKKLSIKQCVKVAELMSNQIAAQATMLINRGYCDFCPNHIDDFYYDSPCWYPGYTNYQI